MSGEHEPSLAVRGGGRPDAGRVPAYVRIMQSVRDRIQRGEFKTGDKIESERELAAIHGVSLMTARHALQELEADGVVTRHVGAGTFVAPPRIQFNKLAGFSEQMAGRGLAPASRVLSLTTVDDNAEAAARLRQPFQCRLIRLERLRLGDREPFALETVYLAYQRFSRMLELPMDRRSLFDVLQTDYGLELAYADEEVDATSADPRSARHLQVAPGAPLLRIRQLLYAASGEPILYDIGLYRSDRHSLNIRRFR